MKTKLLVAIAVALMAATNVFAQGNDNNTDGSINLGKISVYKFKADSLPYSGESGKTLTAVRTEYMANLYALKIENLEITKSYKFDYYDDSGFQFFRHSDYKQVPPTLNGDMLSYYRC